MDDEYFGLVGLCKEYKRDILDITVRSCWTTVVAWLFDIGDCLKISDLTLHIAIHLLDRTLQMVDVPYGRLQLVAEGCFLIACKMREEKIPTLDQIEEFSNNTYSRELLEFIESSIFNVHHGSLLTLTSLHFIFYYLNPIEQSERIKIIKISETLAAHCLQDPNFLLFYPSEVAISCIVLARKIIGYSDLWPQWILDSTTHDLAALNECYHLLEDSFH